MVHQLDAVIDCLGHQAHVLLRRLAAVGAGGGDDEHVLIPDAGGFQLRDQDGDVRLRRLQRRVTSEMTMHTLSPAFTQLPSNGAESMGWSRAQRDMLRRCPLGQIHLVGSSSAAINS